VTIDGRVDVVGREAELATARARLLAGRDGSASTLLITGEAGIGKTTLMDRLLAGLPDDAVVLRGAGLPMAALAAPFMALRSALRDVPPDVSGPPGGDGDRQSTIDPVDFDRWLEDLSASRRVVLAVDDLHWVDAASLDVLLYVVAGGRSRQVSLLLTMRGEAVGEGHPLNRWLADVRRLPGVSEMTLAPLDERKTGEQVAAVVGALPHASLVQDVYERSRGNPYLTRLLVAGVDPGATTLPSDRASALDSAVLASWHEMSPGTRELTTVLALAGRGLTRDEVIELVDGRLDVALVPVQLREAHDGGLVDVDGSGRYWFHHPLQAELLAERTEPGERGIWHKVCARFLESRPVGEPWADLGRFVSISDHYHAAGDHESAYHWALAVVSASPSPRDPAVIRALDRAVELHDRVTAPGETREELLWRLREATREAGDDVAELDAVEALLEATDPTVQPEVAAELIVRRMQLRQLIGVAYMTIGEARIAVELVEDRPGSWQQALALANLSASHAWTELPSDAARQIADRAYSVAESTGSHLALAYALAARSFVATIDGDLDRGRELGRRAHTEARLTRDWWAHLYTLAMELNAEGGAFGPASVHRLAQARRDMIEDGGPHPYAAALAHDIARASLTLGDVHRVREMVRIALGTNTGRFADIGARLVAARLGILTGRLDEAEQHLARAEELSGSLAEFAYNTIHVIRVELDLAKSRPAEALSRCLDVLSMEGRTVDMAEWVVPLAARALAEMTDSVRGDAARHADMADRRDDFERSYPLASSDGACHSPILSDGMHTDSGYRTQLSAFEVWYAAELARAKRSPDAAEVWQRASTCLDETGLPWEAAYAWMRLGEAHLLGDRPDRRAAAAALRTAVQRATALEARPVLEKVEALARSARIDVSAVPEPTEEVGLPGLTRREREILEHVVAGRTYSEIAEALVLSEKTVSSHISNMLRKTGTSNRHDLAARATAASRISTPDG
jgi:DNA-binding CsgD family transcriptional regulator